MTKTERELATIAQECGLTISHPPGQPYTVRDWQGTITGPFTAQQLRFWLAGYRYGMHAHAPDCQCGRLGCTRRNETLAIEARR